MNMNMAAPVIISEEDQQAFDKLAADFSAKVIAESIHEFEYPYALDPAGVAGSVADLGFFSVNLPAEYGGLGLGFYPLAGILEQVSAVDAGLAGTIFANAAALEIVSVASASSGCESVYGTLGQAGALPLAFQAFAAPGESASPAYARKDGAYLLTGRADLVVSGGTAAHAVLPAGRGDGSFSYFLVNLAGPGVKASRPVVTIGMQSCKPVDVELNGAKGVLIGSEGGGRALFEEMCGRMSYPACGIILGIMKGSFRTALEYCEQRYQGGRMIVHWGDVRMKLAGMGSLVDMAGACVAGLKGMFAAGVPDTGACAVSCAVQVGRFSTDATSEGMQLLGGNGYMKDYGQEKRMRDAKQAQCLLGSPLLRKKRFIDAMIEKRAANN
jgi:alkylation response protein AidB-like acyl-CoA dehydrogenase